MKFLLVLSDAFDALWARRGRVAFALAGVAVLGVLVAIYLPLISGGEPPAPPAAGAHNPTVQGPVERTRVAPQAAAAPAPAPAPAAAAVPALAPAPQAATTTDPGSAAEQAPAPEQTPVPEHASAAEAVPAPEPEPAPRAAPAPAAEPVFQVQVGAFREVARAQKLSRRLTHAGFPTSVMRGTTSDGKLIFRVRTRQALPKGQARQLVARLRQRVPALRPILVPGGGAAG
jgi:cell division septation protein DedD